MVAGHGFDVIADGRALPVHTIEPGSNRETNSPASVPIPD